VCVNCVFDVYAVWRGLSLGTSSPSSPEKNVHAFRDANRDTFSNIYDKKQGTK